jgi:hypothetical protein
VKQHPDRELKMQTSEHLFIQMTDTLCHRIQNCEPSNKTYTYEQLARDMNDRGCRTIRGKKIEASNLRRLVSDCNKLCETKDFRQKYYPDFLEDTGTVTIWNVASRKEWGDTDKPLKSDERLERFSHAIIGKYL